MGDSLKLVRRWAVLEPERCREWSFFSPLDGAWIEFDEAGITALPDLQDALQRAIASHSSLYVSISTHPHQTGWRAEVFSEFVPVFDVIGIEPAIALLDAYVQWLEFQNQQSAEVAGG